MKKTHQNQSNEIASPINSNDFLKVENKLGTQKSVKNLGNDSRKIPIYILDKDVEPILNRSDSGN
jgi:hypothetical protein